MVGTGGRKGRTEMGVEARHMFQCLQFECVKQICQAIKRPEYIMTKEQEAREWEGMGVE